MTIRFIEQRNTAMKPKQIANVAALFLTFLPGALLAEQERVTFDVDGMSVVGTLNLPDGVENPPAVVMLSAFGVNRDSGPIAGTDESFFARAARLWAEDGIASLHIDYRFTGESEGEFIDVTMQAHVADGLAALDWLRRDGRVNPDHIGVMGWSMGGGVAASVAGQSDPAVTALVMVNPALNLGTAFTLGLGAEKMAAALASGTAAELVLPSGSMVIGAPFLVSTLEVLPQAELARYDGPVMMAIGTNDTIVFPQPALGEAAMSYHAGEEMLIVRPMDHYLNMAEGPEQIDEIVDLAGDFLNTHLTAK
jgi:dienelactone hydrolase